MGTFKNSAFSKASIYDPATGDVAQMNILVAPDTKFYEPEVIEQPITNGAYQSAWRFKVDFACSDWDAYDQLRTFKDEYTDVRAVAIGAGKNSKNLQWYESVQIAELRRVPKGSRSEGDTFFIVSLIFEGGENAAIFNNVNLLHQANVNGVTVTGFIDDDADNEADGYDLYGASSFASGVQLMNSGTNSDGIYYPDISDGFEFPIATNLRLSIKPVLLHSDAGNALYLKSSSFSATITSDSKTFVNTNRQFIDLVAGTTSYYVNCRIMYIISPSSAQDFSVSLPCLRTDGESTYIAG